MKHLLLIQLNYFLCIIILIWNIHLWDICIIAFLSKFIYMSTKLLRFIISVLISLLVIHLNHCLYFITFKIFSTDTFEHCLDIVTSFFKTLSVKCLNHSLPLLHNFSLEPLILLCLNHCLYFIGSVWKIYLWCVCFIASVS